MGNANTKEARPEPTVRSSKSRSKPAPLVIDPNEMVDGGYLFPQGVYSGPQDFKASVVRERIIRRQMAPFYKGLNDYVAEWTDQRVLEEVDKAGWHPPKKTEEPVGGPATKSTTNESSTSSRRGSLASQPSRVSTNTSSKSSAQTIPLQKVPTGNSGRLSSSVPKGKPTVHRMRSNTTSITQHSKNEEDTQTIWLYRSVHECPICFLMYPRLNSTNCCSQDICTECFVQIKRAAPHPPHNQPTNQPQSYELISEPAACPYCQDRKFGVTFEAPPFEWGISKPSGSSAMVVTPDVLRPDWEHKLAHARRKIAKKSAAAQALYQNALLPEPGTAQEAEQQRRRGSGRRSSRGLTPQEMEQRMIDRAIRQSLRER